MKTSLLVALLLLAATPAFADPPPGEDVLRPKVGGRSGLYWLVDLGLNGTLLDGNPYLRPLMSYEQEDPIFKSGVGFAPLISIGIGYDFSPHFSMELRADYDSRNASNSASVNDTCVLTDPISGNQVKMPMAVDKSYSLNATYLSISLLPAYRFENLFIFAGPSVSIPLSRTLKETDAIVDNTTPCTYLAGTPDSTRTVTASSTDKGNIATRVSLKLGVGYVIDLTPTIEFVPKVGLDLALNDLLTADETMMLKNADRPASTSIDVPVNRHIRLNSLQATVGLRFHF